MTSIKKVAAVVSHSGLRNIIVVICLLSPLVQSQEACAEMKKIAGTSKRLDRLTDISKFYDQTKVQLVNIVNIFSSADPDWNKATHFNVFYYLNPTLEGDSYHGCASITLSNGDHFFITYSETWEWVSPRDGFRWISEEIGYFTGGTGKFKGIRASFKFKGSGNEYKNVTGEWEAEYEILPIGN